MHHTQKKAAIKKMKEANPEITDAEIEIQLQKLEPTVKVDDQIDEATKAIAGDTYPSGRVAPPGKKLYDKWRGQWKAIDTRKNPFGPEQTVVKWRFEYLESKPNKTGIPMSAGEAEIFNGTQENACAGVPTEQLVIHETKPEVIWDRTAEYAL